MENFQVWREVVKAVRYSRAGWMAGGSCFDVGLALASGCSAVFFFFFFDDLAFLGFLPSLLGVR